MDQIFTCPNCEGHEVENVYKDVFVRSILDAEGKSRKDIYDTEGMSFLRSQCRLCGYEIEGDKYYLMEVGNA